MCYAEWNEWEGAHAVNPWGLCEQHMRIIFLDDPNPEK